MTKPFHTSLWLQDSRSAVAKNQSCRSFPPNLHIVSVKYRTSLPSNSDSRSNTLNIFRQQQMYPATEKLWGLSRRRLRSRCPFAPSMAFRGVPVYLGLQATAQGSNKCTLSGIDFRHCGLTASEDLYTSNFSEYIRPHRRRFFFSNGCSELFSREHRGSSPKN